MTDISRRGVYYNLELSPYQYTTQNGQVLKFSSQKKLDIFIRRVDDFKARFERLCDKYRPILGNSWIVASYEIMEANIYKRIYDEVEG